MGKPGRSKSDPHKNRSGRIPLHLPLEVPDEQGLVTLRFLGGAQTTTGSLHRFRTPNGDLLLECGMYQGHRAEAEAWNRDLPVNPHKARAVILSHGHIDHCGALPNLVRRGKQPTHSERQVRVCRAAEVKSLVRPEIDLRERKAKTRLYVTLLKAVRDCNADRRCNTQRHRDEVPVHVDTPVL